MDENVKAILVGITDYSAYENTPDLPLSLKDVDLMGEALVQGLMIHPLHIWVQSFDRGFLARSTFQKGVRLFLQGELRNCSEPGGSEQILIAV